MRASLFLGQEKKGGGGEEGKRDNRHNDDYALHYIFRLPQIFPNFIKKPIHSHKFIV